MLYSVLESGSVKRDFVGGEDEGLVAVRLPGSTDVLSLTLNAAPVTVRLDLGVFTG